MNVLIVESEPDLGGLWQRHLERAGARVDLVCTQRDAINALQAEDYDVLVVDLVLKDGSALTVADFASFRSPGAPVIFVTNTSFFSDGSIFSLASNARAYLPTGTPPEDLAAMVEHYATLR